jgi:hypothetical protein
MTRMHGATMQDTFGDAEVFVLRFAQCEGWPQASVYAQRLMAAG